MSTSSSSAVSVIENRFKSFFLRVCIGLLYLFIAIELVDLLYVVFRGVTTFDPASSRLLLSKVELQQVAPVFFAILIMLELVETIQAYLTEHEIRIQLILLVGLTAITRHLLIFDLKEGNAWQNLSIAALVIALGGAYFLIERARPAPAKS
jgi:uncharacterized membrane protein (DUF373 family)